MLLGLMPGVEGGGAAPAKLLSIQLLTVVD